MAVKRVGTSDNDHLIVRRKLGRLSLTIDDLDSLGDTVAQLSSPSSSVRYEFDGGEFTEASDVRSLSDAELLTLRVISADVQVVLSKKESVAIGTQAKTEEIYSRWARARQVNFFARPMLYAFPSTMAGGAVGLLFIFFDSAGRYPKLDSLAYVVVFAVVLILAVPACAVDIKNECYAKFTPMSRDEIRKLGRADRFPRWALLVTVLSVSVAIGSLIVAVLNL